MICYEKLVFSIHHGPEVGMGLSALSFRLSASQSSLISQAAHTQDSSLQNSQHSSITSNKNVIYLQQEESLFLTFDDRFSVGGHKNADLKLEYWIISSWCILYTMHNSR